MNKQINLKSRPEGTPTKENFEIEQIYDVQLSTLRDGEVLLESKFISVDPYLRGRMRDEKSYIESFKIGEPIESSVIAKVKESKKLRL
ncbi:MAG: hypothetical protein ACSHW7_02970 [Patiriisocius sp.]|uniref:hypothetical protein n=1 Tax=Patiriisocius sp. TaxID=2822396 RepID=UPI003EF73981